MQRLEKARCAKVAASFIGWPTREHNVQLSLPQNSKQKLVSTSLQHASSLCNRHPSQGCPPRRVSIPFPDLRVALIASWLDPGVRFGENTLKGAPLGGRGGEDWHLRPHRAQTRCRSFQGKYRIMHTHPHRADECLIYTSKALFTTLSACVWSRYIQYLIICLT